MEASSAVPGNLRSPAWKYVDTAMPRTGSRTWQVEMELAVESELTFGKMNDQMIQGDLFVTCHTVPFTVAIGNENENSCHLGGGMEVSGNDLRHQGLARRNCSVTSACSYRVPATNSGTFERKPWVVSQGFNWQEISCIYVSSWFNPRPSI